jgi:hypothetical protein
MPRPIKKGCDWYSHDADMRNHRKIKALRKKHKNGYSIWCMTLEFLTSSEENKFKYNDIELEFIAGDFDVEVDELRAVFDYCLTIGLLTKIDGFLRSESLNDRLRPVYAKRTSERVIASDIHVKEELSPSITQTSGVIEGQSTQSIVEYSKGDNTVVNILERNTILAAAIGTKKQELLQPLVTEYFSAAAARNNLIDFDLTSETNSVTNKLILRQVKQPIAFIDKWISKLVDDKNLKIKIQANGHDNKQGGISDTERSEILFRGTGRKLPQPKKV